MLWQDTCAGSRVPQGDYNNPSGPLLKDSTDLSHGSAFKVKTRFVAGLILGRQSGPQAGHLLKVPAGWACLGYMFGQKPPWSEEQAAAVSWSRHEHMRFTRTFGHGTAEEPRLQQSPVPVLSATGASLSQRQQHCCDPARKSSLARAHPCSLPPPLHFSKVLRSVCFLFFDPAPLSSSG